MCLQQPRYDILSIDPGTGDAYRIEVEARLTGASDFWITHNEVITGKNAVPRYRLALVRVDPRGPAFDEVRYLDDPFTNVEMGNFEATGHMGDWAKKLDPRERAVLSGTCYRKHPREAWLGLAGSACAKRSASTCAVSHPTTSPGTRE